MKQVSLFEETPRERGPHGEACVGDAPAAGGAVAFVSVIVDIPSRSLSEPFAYAVTPALAAEVEVGCTVLVGFGPRRVAGYVVMLAPRLADLPGTDGLDPARVKNVISVIAEPAFSEAAAQLAFWMSREYVAPISECIRLFLPPGGSPKVVRRADGSYAVERPAVGEVRERWVSLTE